MAAAVLLIAGLFFIPHGPPPQTSTVASTTAPTAAPAPVASTAAPAPQTTTSSSAEASSGSGVTVVNLAAMDQPARKAFLLRLINQGVFTGVQAPPSPKVGVTPIFQGLSPDIKQQFIAVVDAYVYNGAAGDNPLQVIDATNGKVMGSYTPSGGLKLE